MTQVLQASPQTSAGPSLRSSNRIAAVRDAVAVDAEDDADVSVDPAWKIENAPSSARQPAATPLTRIRTILPLSRTVVRRIFFWRSTTGRPHWPFLLPLI
jgi:hypothetical protein